MNINTKSDNMYSHIDTRQWRGSQTLTPPQH